MRPKKAPSHQTPSGLIAMCWMGWGASLQSTFVCFMYLPTAPWELSSMHRWGKYSRVKFPHFTWTAFNVWDCIRCTCPFFSCFLDSPALLAMEGRSTKDQHSVVDPAGQWQDASVRIARAQTRRFLTHGDSTMGEWSGSFLYTMPHTYFP